MFDPLFLVAHSRQEVTNAYLMKQITDIQIVFMEGNEDEAPAIFHKGVWFEGGESGSISQSQFDAMLSIARSSGNFDASSLATGFMTASNMQKLDGIETNANHYELTEQLLRNVLSKSIIETILTGQITTHTHPSGEAGNVSWSQLISQGTKIATITIGQNSTDVYVPSGTNVQWSQQVHDGTKIASVNINGIQTDIYIPKVYEILLDGDISSTFTLLNSAADIQKFYADLSAAKTTQAYLNINGEYLSSTSINRATANQVTLTFIQVDLINNDQTFYTTTLNSDGTFTTNYKKISI